MDKKSFNTILKKQLLEYGFEENEDYTCLFTLLIENISIKIFIFNTYKNKLFILNHDPHLKKDLDLIIKIQFDYTFQEIKEIVEKHTDVELKNVGNTKK